MGKSIYLEAIRSRRLSFRRKSKSCSRDWIHSSRAYCRVRVRALCILESLLLFLVLVSSGSLPFFQENESVLRSLESLTLEMEIFRFFFSFLKPLFGFLNVVILFFHFCAFVSRF